MTSKVTNPRRAVVLEQLTSERTGLRRTRSQLLAYGAAGWAASYGVLALAWTVTGSGFPFGTNDPDAELSTVRAVSPEVGAPALALLLAVTAATALVMAGPLPGRLSSAARATGLGIGWLMAAVLLFVLPDTRLLARVGYAPMLLIGLPFGWPDDMDYSVLFTWPVVNQLWCVVGGLLVAGTVLSWQRRTRALCPRCGRGPGAASWTRPSAAARWGRPATYVAAAVPLVYAIDRLAWLAGIPLLITDEMLADLQESGAVWAGAGLGAFALVGTILTLGLVQHWGDVFPRWMVGLAGRRVPVGLAVVPASIVAVLVTSAGLPVIVNFGALRDNAGPDQLAVLPMLLWPLWGVALGAATLAYYLRRRARCQQCGQR